MKNREIATMQDLRDVVLDTLGQFIHEYDTTGLATHLYEISSHDGTEYHGRILDQGDDTLIMVDDFWKIARRYHHPTVMSRDPSHAGPFYRPPPTEPDPELEPVTPGHPTPP